ncbi:MAG TPA: 16S rRNA (guanine(966)-N(2))-methyltransferase RsmD [Chromatiaceae bacterium]|nr:16S rRNA (guanine(966)-N(2))-methyltransferase RsmD [Chromatiaceae bacterium]
MAHSNSIRIIGGRYRGRRLRFPGVAGLRPTADRLRETLFNWLQAEIGGARCLDPFAGSGALGLEALSRGAAHVQFFDRAPVVIRKLRENLKLLGLEHNAGVIQGDTQRLLRRTPEQPYDIVFLDPPYARDLLQEACEQLEGKGWLADRAWVYLEQESHRPWFDLPTGWSLHREASAGQAACRLVRRVKMQGHS